MPVRKLIGGALIAIIVVNVTAGVAALLLSTSKGIGDFEGRILLTTLAVSLGIAGLLPPAIAWERWGPARSEGGAGLAVAAVVLATAAVVARIWADFVSEDRERVTWSLAAIAFSLSLINLVSLAHLPPAQRWVRYLAYLLAGLLAAQFIAGIWSDDPGDNRLRMLFATAIVLAGTCGVIPILQRLTDAGPPEQPRYCPRCGARLGDTAGREATCGECGASFRVDFATGRRVEVRPAEETAANS